MMKKYIIKNYRLSNAGLLEGFRGFRYYLPGAGLDSLEQECSDYRFMIIDCDGSYLVIGNNCYGLNRYGKWWLRWPINLGSIRNIDWLLGLPVVRTDTIW